MAEQCPKCGKYSVGYDEELERYKCYNYGCAWTSSCCPICFEELLHMFGEHYLCSGCNRVYNDISVTV